MTLKLSNLVVDVDLLFDIHSIYIYNYIYITGLISREVIIM